MENRGSWSQLDQIPPIAENNRGNSATKPCLRAVENYFDLELNPVNSPLLCGVRLISWVDWKKYRGEFNCGL